MAANFLHVGFSGYVDANSILAILSPDSAPVRRMMREAESQNKIINMTYGRKTKSVAVHNTGHLSLLALQPETIMNRWRALSSSADDGGSSG